MENEYSGKKIFIVDGLIELRFGVTGTTEEEATQEARNRVKKSMENEAFGPAVGWTFSLKRIQEAKPVER